ncbi:hypothetical protein BJ742DRAFT_895451 [Cladochytrium replicatum]|nr:hypothetical protein BJ742DRAFT_895451 [Cladochytrium replicatum]
MLALKHRFEQAIRDRNSAEIHVLDRNDELCILYEKLNIQSSVLVKWEAELALREEEIRELGLTLSELYRWTELLKRQMPQVDEYDRELSPDDPTRCRKLAGVDPGQNELLETVKKLEELLCEKEQRLLGKDLILEEVTTLTERLRNGRKSPGRKNRNKRHSNQVERLDRTDQTRHKRTNDESLGALNAASASHDTLKNVWHVSIGPKLGRGSAIVLVP